MLTTWTALRLTKLLIVVLLAGGVFALLTHAERARRIALAHGLVTPALLAAWAAGYLAMKQTGVGFTPWILASLGASLAGLHGCLRVAHAAEPGLLARTTAVGGLLVSVALMVTRAEAAPTITLALVTGLLVAAPVAAWTGPDAWQHAEEDTAAVLPWFLRLARLEGLSLIALVLIAMPLRRLADIHVDGGTGLLGWVHGSLFLVYLRALLSAGTHEGWRPGRVLAGAVASVVPFGTFLFERRLSRATPAMGAARD